MLGGVWMAPTWKQGAQRIRSYPHIQTGIIGSHMDCKHFAIAIVSVWTFFSDTQEKHMMRKPSGVHSSWTVENRNAGRYFVRIVIGFVIVRVFMFVG